MAIPVGNHQAKQADNFKYLGVNFNEENLREIELNEGIQKYNTNLNMLYPILADNHVPTKCKTIIFNSILKPILTYESESWSLTSKIKSKLQAAEMRKLRIIRGVTRRDRMRNVRIREELQVNAMLDEVESGMR